MSYHSQGAFRIEKSPDFAIEAIILVCKCVQLNGPTNWNLAVWRRCFNDNELQRFLRNIS